MAPHSSTLAWRIPWTEESGRLQTMGSLRVEHNWATSLSLFTFMHRRRKWQPTPVFLPGGSQGRGETGGLPSMGSHRVGHDCSDLAAACIYIYIYIYVCVYIYIYIYIYITCICFKSILYLAFYVPVVEMIPFSLYCIIYAFMLAGFFLIFSVF